MKYIFPIFLILVLYRCAPSRYVKPLAKKENSLALSFGGPLIKFSGAPIPIPFTTLGYGYGLTDNITAYGNLHTTSALFGNSQLDLGATFSLYKKENSFGITASPALQMAYSIANKTGFRVWPSADANIYFHPAKKTSYLYAGINSWFEFSKLRAHGEDQKKHLVPNLQMGYVIAKTKWQHQFEFKYLGAGIPNTPGVVEYIGISGKGALGIYYSLVRKF